VVVMIEGMAASGAYYLAAGGDYVYSKPSSYVGNIGVISTLPEKPAVFEETYSTGPYKLWGSPRETVVREMEVLKQGFLRAVQLGRGSALKAPPEVILRGQIYSGSEALKLGLVDGMGAQSQAFEKAAQLAHIAHYEVTDLRPLSGLPTYVALPFSQYTQDGKQTHYPKESGIYLLYIPPTEVQP
jgi:protease IV